MLWEFDYAEIAEIQRILKIWYNIDVIYRTILYSRNYVIYKKLFIVYFSQ